ncbi:hypothetical protein OE88DRAFT_1038367 [Heliocybe sulcata]|uniref:Mixed lineage kinase domain-containing protein n=1 Tax=Heliocybe sulcata TaxID=5364 RepID=A0A5C3MXH0_9AGAM|nr:hypothetical protein OE88DRAFT_1038367 [Heliocybe sulcata]
MRPPPLRWHTMPSWLRRRKKKGRPPDEDRQERRVPLESFQVAAAVVGPFLDGSVIAMPILKPVSEAVQQIVTICQAMQTNKEDATGLAKEICDRLQLLTGVLERTPPQNVNTHLEDDLARFTEVLMSIRTRMEKLCARGRVRRFMKHKSDQKVIEDCRRDSKTAFDNFMSASLTFVRRNSRFWIRYKVSYRI